MITYETNDLLYEKLADELNSYRLWLLKLPAEKILEHAYQYSVKQNIVMYSATADLDSESVATLLESPCALDDIYDALDKFDSFRVSDIGDAITEAAERLEISYLQDWSDR